MLGDDLSSVGEAAAAFDLETIYLASHEALGSYTPGGWVTALAQVIEMASPAVVLLPHTYQSVDFMSQLAQRLGVGLVSEATGFEVVEGRIVWTRPVMGGKLNARVAAKGEGPVMVSLQSGSYAGDDARPGSASAEEVAWTEAPVADREILGTEEVAGDQVDLTQANTIVAVGRGIGDGDKVAVAQELADLLGAEMAASRPVIDNGWLPRDRQIGSSGQTVSPKLYVALGVSGAIQHLVGMKGSKTVVAVNRDASAPIFSVADYGYVGDLHEFVPAFNNALRERGEG